LTNATPKTYAYESRILLVRESAVLPPDLTTEDDTFLPGWRVVKNFDEYAMRQKIRKTDWSFLQLRGGKETKVMGRVHRQILQKGVARLLTEVRGRKFNSLEINIPVSRHFLGPIFLNISVSLRHFQYNTAV